MIKTREQIITSMCFTYRHDFGLPKFVKSEVLESGMYPEERQELWNQMAQIFDNDIAPNMEFKND